MNTGVSGGGLYPNRDAFLFVWCFIMLILLRKYPLQDFPSVTEVANVRYIYKKKKDKESAAPLWTLTVDSGIRSLSLSN